MPPLVKCLPSIHKGWVESLALHKADLAMCRAGKIGYSEVQDHPQFQAIQAYKKDLEKYQYLQNQKFLSQTDDFASGF